MKEIEFDLGRESLFVMIDGQEINADAVRKEDRIIAAISIDDDPQVERLDCWSHKLAPGAELSRLAVHPDFQNQKIARQMLVFGMEELARRGYKSVHFLVNKLNVKALRSYAVFGFDTVGECSLFGQPFLVLLKRVCKKYDFFEKSACIFENNLILYTSRVRQAAKTKYMRKCRNWQTSKTKDLVIIAIVWVQVPSSALNNKTGTKQNVWSCLVVQSRSEP